MPKHAPGSMPDCVRSSRGAAPDTAQPRVGSCATGSSNSSSSGVKAAADQRCRGGAGAPDIPPLAHPDRRPRQNCFPGRRAKTEHAPDAGFRFSDCPCLQNPLNRWMPHESRTRWIKVYTSHRDAQRHHRPSVDTHYYVKKIPSNLLILIAGTTLRYCVATQPARDAESRLRKWQRDSLLSQSVAQGACAALSPGPVSGLFCLLRHGLRDAHRLLAAPAPRRMGSRPYRLVPASSGDVRA